MSNEELAAIEYRWGARSGAEWRLTPSGCEVIVRQDGREDTIIRVVDEDSGVTVSKQEIAAFIVGARTDVPWLVAALRAERDTVRRLQQQLTNLSEAVLGRGAP